MTVATMFESGPLVAQGHPGGRQAGVVVRLDAGAVDNVAGQLETSRRR